MQTPIFDFVKKYAESGACRMHMPGHKGVGDIELFDITEIAGADSLYEASGIIAESERGASELFSADTFYSAEGSSLSIRAMLYLVSLYAAASGKKGKILACRNAHKTFVTALALLDLDADFIMPRKNDSYVSCSVTAEDIEQLILSSEQLPTAVYLTSPDYLGNMLDIRKIAEVCHKHGVLLLVDNAHGAYLKFLEKSLHPIDLGADICCDSAHKTLPALTGAAYLHISKSAPRIFRENAKDALALFGSTSPSYLILASLDKTNKYLAEGYSERLIATADKLKLIKRELAKLGYTFIGDEPMKLTLNAKKYGYSGTELARLLSEMGVVCEFADPDFTVLMPSAETTDSELRALKHALTQIKRKSEIYAPLPEFSAARRAMTPREAILAPSELVPVSKALGRILAAVTVGCPPAVPILVSGEIIDESAIRCFEYYNIHELKAVKS